jgi:hypothetical protein
VTESYNLECTRTPEGSYLMDEKPAKTLELYPYEVHRLRDPGPPLGPTIIFGGTCVEGVQPFE